MTLKQLIWITVIAATIHSCRTRMIPTNTKVSRQSRKEIQTKINPFKLEASDNIEIDKDGNIKPLELTLKYEDLFEGIVSVKNDIVKFTLENTDTLDLGTKIETTKETEDVTTIPVKKPLPKIIWWSIGINVVLLLLFILRVVARVHRPI